MGPRRASLQIDRGSVRGPEEFVLVQSQVEFVSRVRSGFCEELGIESAVERIGRRRRMRKIDMLARFQQRLSV